jgi:acetyltransferase-like isoleucine patch superfamily enzyme
VERLQTNFGKIKHGLWLITEKLLRWCVHPWLRARVLNILGAQIEANVRVDEIMIVNPVHGFTNLSIGHDSYIGAGTVIDLIGKVEVGCHTSIAPRCMLMTHSDPGSQFGSDLCAVFPRTVSTITIGNHVWVGAGTIILEGVTIGDYVVVGAGSLVNHSLPDHVLAYGQPARVIKELPPLGRPTRNYGEKKVDS